MHTYLYLLHASWLINSENHKTKGKHDLLNKKGGGKEKGKHINFELL